MGIRRLCKIVPDSTDVNFWRVVGRLHLCSLRNLFETWVIYIIATDQDFITKSSTPTQCISYPCVKLRSENNLETAFNIHDTLGLIFYSIHFTKRKGGLIFSSSRLQSAFSRQKSLDALLDKPYQTILYVKICLASYSELYLHTALSITSW